MAVEETVGDVVEVLVDVVGVVVVVVLVVVVGVVEVEVVEDEVVGDVVVVVLDVVVGFKGQDLHALLILLASKEQMITNKKTKCENFMIKMFLS